MQSEYWQQKKQCVKNKLREFASFFKFAGFCYELQILLVCHLVYICSYCVTHYRRDTEIRYSKQKMQPFKILTRYRGGFLTVSCTDVYDLRFFNLNLTFRSHPSLMSHSRLCITTQHRWLNAICRK